MIFPLVWSIKRLYQFGNYCNNLCGVIINTMVVRLVWKMFTQLGNINSKFVSEIMVENTWNELISTLNIYELTWISTAARALNYFQSTRYFHWRDKWPKPTIIFESTFLCWVIIFWNESTTVITPERFLNQFPNLYNHWLDK